MSIPYRTRQGLRRFAVVLLVLILVAVLAWICWMLWLSRFVIYTRDGAKLDFDLQPVQTGQLAAPPEIQETVSIYYNEGENQIETSTELAQMIGYYVTGEDLAEDISAVRAQIQALPAGTAVMVDVKNIQGSFFYSSAVGTRRHSDIDPTAMDSLISYLRSSGMYIIARFPALRDYEYGLNNVPDGLHHSSRLYLWQDSQRCYWLDPTSNGTVEYLARIVNELKGLGFDEVVLTDFYVPEDDRVYFSGDRVQTLANTANTLLSTCATETFAVSFVGSTGFTLPEGRSRLYLENAEGSTAATMAEESGVADTAVKLVFITELHDTRFDVYSVLRPLSAAH